MFSVFVLNFEFSKILVNIVITHFWVTPNFVFFQITFLFKKKKKKQQNTETVPF